MILFCKSCIQIIMEENTGRTKYLSSCGFIALAACKLDCTSSSFLLIPATNASPRYIPSVIHFYKIKSQDLAKFSKIGWRNSTIQSRNRNVGKFRSFFFGYTSTHERAHAHTNCTRTYVHTTTTIITTHTYTNKK